MKAVAFIPRSVQDPISQDIDAVLTEHSIQFDKSVDSQGCTYSVADEDYDTAVALINDPYKVT